MSLIFADGLIDRLSDKGKYNIDTLVENTTVPSRHGDGTECVRFAPTNANSLNERYGKTFSATDKVAAGVAFYPYAGNDRRAFLQFRAANGTLLASVTYQASSGKLFLRQGDHNATIRVESAAGVASNNEWGSVTVLIDNTAGTVELYYKTTFLGNSAISLPNNIGEVAICSAVDTGTNDTAFQDFWITDGDLLRDARIASISPDAAGASADWSPSDELSANHDLVSGTVNADTYVFSDIIGDRDSHGFQNLTVTDSRSQIYAVQACAMVDKSDSSPRALSLSVRSNAEYYDGPSQNIEGPSVLTQAWSNNPATSGEWELEEVNTAEFGYVAG